MRKRDDPNHELVEGYINKATVERFKKHCAKISLDISTALEVVVKEYLETEEAE